MSRPLVLAGPERRPPWARRLPRSFCRAQSALPSDLSGVDSVWIDATDLQPLQVAREVAALDPSVQTIVVSPPEDMGIHERTMLFTPGLGEVWLMGPDEVGTENLDRAREVTEKRRRYRETRGKAGRIIEEFARGRPRRAIVSDAYLAALLQVLPDPVISVDDEGRVVSWSPASERCFRTADVHVLGRPVVDVLGPEDADALVDALKRSREGPTKLDVVVGGTDRRLIMEAVITPVSAGGFNVRVLVLRDVTRERESVARLKREDELRSRSYAAMSHEIRTPINAIMGYNELLRLEAGGEEKRDEYLKRSQKAAAHLLALLNDVLDLSKLESGMIELQREPTRIEEVVQDLVSTLDPLARERGSPLEIDCDADAGEIDTDSRRLSQILINLVSNALKFGEGRPVSVRCRRTRDAVVFEVEDQGPGIEPSQLDRIFEEFVQVGNGDEGTGLGLPISRKLAELLGGTLTVESEPGQGSLFRLRLPLEPDPSSSGTPAGESWAGEEKAGAGGDGRAGRTVDDQPGDARTLEPGTPDSRPERTGASPRNPG